MNMPMHITFNKFINDLMEKVRRYYLYYCLV